MDIDVDIYRYRYKIHRKIDGMVYPRISEIWLVGNVWGLVTAALAVGNTPPNKWLFSMSSTRAYLFHNKEQY